MTDRGKPVTEEDLHAYADAQLSSGDVARIEARLANNPEEAARVRAWRQQNRDIQAMYEPYRRSRPDDDVLLSTRDAPSTSPGRWKTTAVRAAAAACIFMLGVGVGRYAPLAPGNKQFAPVELHQEASSAFLIYASEVRHPVEVRANDKDHLVKWLSNKLGHQLAAPDLSARGFSLVGGRLVPVNGRAGALLMYEDAEGKRLTILLGQSEPSAVTRFRFASEGRIETFYWIDEKLSYAVTGEIPRDLLRQVADDCYQQFQTL